MRPVVLAVLLLAVSGCAGLGDLFRPGYHVATSTLHVGADAWNRDGTFLVQVQEDVPIHIEATDAAGHGVQANGERTGTLEIPDGTWAVSYTVGGHPWESFSPVRVDATPPDVSGLDLVGLAPSGAYTIGAKATVTGATAVTVTDLDAGTILGNGLPVSLTGLTTGLHLYEVAARDEAGNWANATVQVRAGSTDTLPPGQYDFGIVARYNDVVRLWDIRHLELFQSPATARQAVLSATGATYITAGYGVTPDDPAVKAIANATVPPGSTTGQAALQLYHWVFDHLDYNKSRLVATDLLMPAQTLAAHGGVCRDLAALYVSLLRSAGIPARLVTGYVAGTVGDFHAWVEFYGAPSSAPSPWVPVDVSPIDGPYQDAVMLSAFGIHLPEYLMLRQLPPTAEVKGWESVGTLATSSPQNAATPDVQFHETVTAPPTTTRLGVLCVNLSTHQRATADSERSCPGGTTHIAPNFVLSTERVLDYGVQVVSAPHGTTVTASLAYPFSDPQGQDVVTYQFYGSSFSRDESAGVVRGTLTR